MAGDAVTLGSCLWPRTAVLTGLLIALAATAQVNADMIVILSQPGFVVVAADSRRGLRPGMNHTTSVDDECKIRRGGRTVFVASDAYPDNLLWQVFENGERLAKRYGSAAQNRDEMVAMLSRWTFVLTRELIGRFAFLELTPSGPMLQGAEVTMGARGRATFAPVSSGATWYESPGYYAMGNDAPGLIEAIRKSLTASRTQPELIAIATSAIRTQSRIDSNVGGAIDILVLDAAGGRWIDVKNNCR